MFPGCALSHEPKTSYLDAKGPPLHFDSVLPPNRLEYLVTLAMNTTDCNPALANSGIRGDISGGQAFLTAQPFSLIDPVLPFGYGFALVEDSGVVLFHVDKTRNLRENFLQESDWNKQLSAAAFGHSTQGALHIKYLGKDYRARVVPISGLSQAPWSLIVYRDLTSVRTLDLQSITMASTLLLLFLAVPFVVIAVCCLIYRPRFAPEFVWPNPSSRVDIRLSNCPLCGFDRCFPVSGFPRFGGGKCDCVRGGSLHRSALDVLVFPVVSGAGTGSPAARGWVALPRGLVGIDRHRLPGRARRAVALFEASHALVGRCRNRGGSSASPAAPVYRADVQALVPVPTVPTAKSLRHPKPPSRLPGLLRSQRPDAGAADWRLDADGPVPRQPRVWSGGCRSNRRNCIWHRLWSSTRGRNRRSTSEGGSQRLCVSRVLPGHCRMAKNGVHPAVHSGWHSVDPGPLHPRPARRSTAVGSAASSTRCITTTTMQPRKCWESFRTAAVPIPPRIGPGKTRRPPITLVWHGAHPPARNPNGEEKPPKEHDLVIQSAVPGFSGGDTWIAVGIATGVMLLIGGIFWALAQKLFLFHIAPLKLNGQRQVAESLRDGRNVLILLPPVSDWQWEEPTWKMDVAEPRNRAQMGRTSRPGHDTAPNVD